MPTRSIPTRLRELELRMAVVEARLGMAPAAPVPPAPAPEPTPGPLPLPRPWPPRSRTPERTRREKGAARRARRRPQRDLEVDFGRRLLSRLGAGSLVLAAGFLFHYAAQRGLIGPGLRFASGLAGGLALLGAGERLQRRYAHFSAALTGAGIAILFIALYAGYALFRFYGSGPALGATSVVVAAGLAQALRHRVEAVAGLAAAGAYAAPLLVLDPHAQPVVVAFYALILGAGLCVLRAKTDWRSPEVLAWLGTPLVVAQPLAAMRLAPALGFLLAFGALFGVRPRTRPTARSWIYVTVLSAATASTSYLLFELHETPGWPVFAGALALVLGVTSIVRPPGRPGSVAGADLAAGAGFAALAVVDGFDGWQVTLGLSALSAACSLVPWPRERTMARRLGRVLALLALLHVVCVDALVPDRRLAAFLLAGGALAAVRGRWFERLGVITAALGLAAEVAAQRGAEAWSTLGLLAGETLLPSTRLLAGATLAAVCGLYAWARREPRLAKACVAGFAFLAVAEGLYALDGIGHVPPGLLAALALYWAGRTGRTIWAVAAGLAVAAAVDLVPPAGFLPLLNRRAFAVGAVLLVGWAGLRGRPEGRATALLALLLGAAELASFPDRAGGSWPWPFLALDLRATAGIAPFWNVRFLFLAGAAGVAFLGARRWRWLQLAGHAWLVAALGAETAGLVAPALRDHPWSAFHDPGRWMGPQLALTGVVLVYGAGLVARGVLRLDRRTRLIGLALLAAGALKVSLVDLAALGDLYRVGSFLVLGLTYLAGSYAYNRRVSAGDGTQFPQAGSRPPRPGPMR